LLVGGWMNSAIIELIKKKRNILRNRILRRGIFSSKKEKEILNKLDELLLEQYKKVLP